MINVVFFAQLREQLGCAEVQVDADNETVEFIRSLLIKERPDWQAFLLSEDILISVNHTMAKNTAYVRSGDELAFFPPVTGG